MDQTLISFSVDEKKVLVKYKPNTFSKRTLKFGSCDIVNVLVFCYCLAFICYINLSSHNIARCSLWISPAMHCNTSLNSNILITHCAVGNCYEENLNL